MNLSKFSVLKKNMYLMVTLFVLSLSNSLPLNQEYCSIHCSSASHTMCSFKSISAKCRQIDSLIDSTERVQIVALHNALRNEVASGKWLSTNSHLPYSSNMKEIYWDFELESIAKRWAFQCEAVNDLCRDVRRFKVGQIMSKSSVLTRSFTYYETLLRTVWFSEIENLTDELISYYQGEEDVKHIAQILSANTSRIGCADVIYNSINNNWQRITICNYGPAVENKVAIYKIGDSCTECSSGTRCLNGHSYPHLCSESPYNSTEQSNVQSKAASYDLVFPLLNSQRSLQDFRHPNLEDFMEITNSTSDSVESDNKQFQLNGGRNLKSAYKSTPMSMKKSNDSENDDYPLFEEDYNSDITSKSTTATTENNLSNNINQTPVPQGSSLTSTNRLHFVVKLSLLFAQFKHFSN